MTAAESSRRGVSVEVTGLPPWLPAERLLGLPGFELQPDGTGRLTARAILPRRDAADLAARLRGVGLDGRSLVVQVQPPLPRAAVRGARTRDARRRRNTSVGLSRPGVRLDPEGRYSLTPEGLALQLGREAMAAGLGRVFDAGCGAGGNSIGFARAGCQVYAVDRSPERLALARHNAEVYGVGTRIHFAAGDAMQHVGTRVLDLIFVDPPWGPDWDRACTGARDFPLLAALHRLPGRPPLWAKVPPSFEVAQLPGAIPSAVFGEAEGDRNRVKFVLLRCPA